MPTKEYPAGLLGGDEVYRIVFRWESGKEDIRYDVREWVAFTEACGNSLSDGMAYARVDYNVGSHEDQEWHVVVTFCHGYRAWSKTGWGT